MTADCRVTVSASASATVSVLTVSVMRAGREGIRFMGNISLLALLVNVSQ